MNIVKFTLASFVLITAIAFSYSKTKIDSAEFGVCSSNDRSIINLKLMEDGSFCYAHYNMKRVTGTWLQDGNEVLLTPDGSVTNFRNVWKLERDNLAIKSRLGMSFYRLINLEKCRDCEHR